VSSSLSTKAFFVLAAVFFLRRGLKVKLAVSRLPVVVVDVRGLA